MIVFKVLRKLLVQGDDGVNVLQGLFFEKDIVNLELCILCHFSFGVSLLILHALSLLFNHIFLYLYESLKLCHLFILSLEGINCCKALLFNRSIDLLFKHHDLLDFQVIFLDLLLLLIGLLLDNNFLIFLQTRFTLFCNLIFNFFFGFFLSSKCRRLLHFLIWFETRHL